MTILIRKFSAFEIYKLASLKFSLIFQWNFLNVFTKTELNKMNRIKWNCLFSFIGENKCLFYFNVCMQFGKEKKSLFCRGFSCDPVNETVICRTLPPFDKRDRQTSICPFRNWTPGGRALEIATARNKRDNSSCFSIINEITRSFCIQSVWSNVCSLIYSNSGLSLASQNCS